MLPVQPQLGGCSPPHAVREAHEAPSIPLLLYFPQGLQLKSILVLPVLSPCIGDGHRVTNDYHLIAATATVTVPPHPKQTSMTRPTAVAKIEANPLPYAPNYPFTSHNLPCVAQAIVSDQHDQDEVVSDL